MRVLHVNDYRALGGAEVVMDATVRLLRERGLEADTFTADDVPGLRRTPRSYIDSPAARRALARRLAELRPDVVHLHNYYHLLSPGILAALSAYRPLRVVMTAHDYHLVCPNAGLFSVRRGAPRPADERRLASLGYVLGRRWDARGLAHSLLKTAQHVWNYRVLRRRRVIDCLLCPSRYLQGIAARHGLPARFVPHPAPRPMPGRAGPRPQDALHLVFAGRVEPEKGLVEFLEALPAGFAGRLTIVGDGSRVERCRAVCRARGLAARFTGQVSRDEAMSVIARGHVLVLPSLLAENHPMVLVEALALGTNILVCDLGGMREIVEDAGVGFRFTAGDPEGLALALSRVEAAFRDGSLNRFDASGFLGDRSEHLYTERLLAAYEGRPCESSSSRPASPR